MDLGIIGTIIAIVIVVIIVISLRALREKYVWMDGVVAFIMIGAVIAGWIIGGFWMGVATFIGSLLVIGLLFGLGNDYTEVRIDVHTTAKIKCPQCNYGKLDIISSRYHSEQKVTSIDAKCKRCGKVTNFIG